MLRYDQVQELYALAREDSWCKQCLAQVTELEDAFLRLRESLDLEEQALLDAYINACEEASFSLIYPAYHLGRWDSFREGR